MGSPTTVAKMSSYILIAISFLCMSCTHARSPHCPRDQVETPCKPGTGMRVYNDNAWGQFWDPSLEVTVNNNDGWDCVPCCSLRGTTLIHCSKLQGDTNPG